jgi:uncharacterized Zn finger protein
LPSLTDDTTRAWVDSGSFERGLEYYEMGHILTPRVRLPVLRARCLGSRPAPYTVELVLGDRSILGGACSCPVGDAGRCKRIASLRERYRRLPALQDELSRAGL